MKRLPKLNWIGCALLIVLGSVFALPQSGKVVGGEPAADGEFPYHVILQANTSSINYTADPHCAGALVSIDNAQFVLSTVSCGIAGYYPDEEISIYAGITNRDDNNHAQRRTLKQYIPHEGFQDETYIHDIAILILDRPFEINEFVGTIPLPTQGQETPDWPGYVIATGFGVTEEAEYSRVLRKVTLPVFPDDICQNVWRPRRVSQYQICVGGIQFGLGTCDGDSGGPVKELEDGYLAGLTSYRHRDCGHGYFPALSTEVAHYIDWIKFRLEHDIEK